MKPARFRSVTTLLAIVALLAAVIAPRPAEGWRQAGNAFSATGYQLVSVGDKVGKELSPGESCLFSIILSSNEYLRLAVSSWGAGIAAAVLGPPGAKVAVEALIDENPTYLSLVSAATGRYAVQITSTGAGSAVARFELRVDERRPGRQTDRFRLSAERNYLEAAHLQKQWTPEFDKRAVEKLKAGFRLLTAVRDQEAAAHILCSLGDMLQDRGRLSEALTHYEQSLQISREAGNQRGVADALTRIGLIQVQTGEGQRALEALERVLKISQDTGNLRNAALTLANIGEAHYWMGRQREALSFYQQAAQVWRTVGERRGLAVTLYYLGSAYKDLSEVRNAFQYFDQSLELWRAIGDRHGEALTLTQVGSLFGRVGEKQAAITWFRRAAQLFQRGGDPVGEAMLMDKFAYVYHSLGYLDAALDYYRKALRLYGEARFPDGEAGQLMKIGEVHLNRGEDPTALEYLEKSLALYRQIQDQRMQAYSLYNMGRVHRRLGHADRAIDCFQQALQLSRASDDINAESYALTELGLVYRETGAARKSVDYFLEALTLNQKAQDPFGEVQTRYGLAQAHRRLGNPAEALNQIKKSIEIVESLRTKVDVPSLRVSYFSTIWLIYDLYVELLMESHRIKPSEAWDVVALRVSERARARNLLDLLGEARAGIRQGIQASLSERERELLRSLNAKAQQQTQLMSRRHSQEEADKLAAEIRALNIEYDQLQAEIRNQNPNYAALTQPRPLSLQEIQEGILDEKTLLLEYSLGEEHSYLWAVNKNGMTSYELPAREKIESLARKVRELLTARQQRLPAETASQFHKRSQEADAQYWKSAAELSRILLGPVVGKLGECRLLVVADGILQYLPFGALPVPGSEIGTDPAAVQQANLTPLIAEHEIVSLPSASTLGVLRQQIEGRKPAELSVAVLADPVFQRDDPRLTLAATSPRSGNAAPRASPGGTSLRGGIGTTDLSASREAPAFSRLVFSGREANDITSTVALGSGALWVGSEASREKAASRELARYRIVHFATHGVIDDTHPNLSGIVLSMYDAKGREQDGFLRLHDIYNLNLPAELVVLSACNTGLGKDVRGEGFIGLVRGFMYAGAARVVASLWRVDDQSTAELMKRFYRAMLKEGLSPAAALRAAQVEMSKHERWSAPYHWAAFVLQGEYR